MCVPTLEFLRKSFTSASTSFFGYQTRAIALPYSPTFNGFKYPLVVHKNHFICIFIRKYAYLCDLSHSIVLNCAKNKTK